jgi:hypothetical protein
MPRPAKYTIGDLRAYANLKKVIVLCKQHNLHTKRKKPIKYQDWDYC